MLILVLDFLREMLWLLGEMAPYLVLGFVLAGLLHVFVPKKAVSRHLGGNNVRSVVKAAVLGVPMPLCSCGVVPTAMGLHKRGASKGAVVAFLISTPQTGLDSIFATYAFFGWRFAMFCPIAAFVTGIVGGIATLFLKHSPADEARWQRHHVPAEDTLAQQTEPRTLPQKLKAGAHFAFIELLGDIALWLVVGLAVAALISLVIPDDFFAGSLPSGFMQMLVMMAFGIPLYVCSMASIPIAAVLMAKGITAGAAFVFLTTGPVTNAATMMIISRVMGWRVLAVYLATIAVLSLGFGLGLDALIGQTGHAHDMTRHLHEEMLPPWLTWGSAGLLTFFIVYHFLEAARRRRNFRRISMASGRGLDLFVDGMNCSHCASTVSQSLKNVPGVTAAEVSLETGCVHIEGEDLDREQLAQAVSGAGYKVRSE